MTGSRLALLIVQIAGGITLLPYPFILLANVMSIAAPNQTWRGALPFILLTVYPAAWIGLWALSWRTLAGAAVVAFALSSIPVIAGVVGIALWKRSDSADQAGYRELAQKVRNEVEPLNPLLWTILCTGTRTLAWGADPVSADDAIKAIAAHPELVNVGVAGYGSPLTIALINMKHLPVDGHIPPDRQDQIRVIRALAAHGAKMRPHEQTNLWRTWQLRRALLDGPVTTATENPLVWRIVTRKENADGPLGLRPDEMPLLNTPTRLHGSPAYAALLTNGVSIFPELWKAGARLTPEEALDPAARQALEEMRKKLGL